MGIFPAAVQGIGGFRVHVFFLTPLFNERFVSIKKKGSCFFLLLFCFLNLCGLINKVFICAGIWDIFGSFLVNFHSYLQTTTISLIEELLLRDKNYSSYNIVFVKKVFLFLLEVEEK